MLAEITERQTEPSAVNLIAAQFNIHNRFALLPRRWRVTRAAIGRNFWESQLKERLVTYEKWGEPVSNKTAMEVLLSKGYEIKELFGKRKLFHEGHHPRHGTLTRWETIRLNQKTKTNQPTTHAT